MGSTSSLVSTRCRSISATRSDIWLHARGVIPCRMRGGPEESERRWLAETFRPDEPQLTWRALAAGVVIGALLCLSNLYVALKTGWSLGVTVTASVMAWGLFAAARSAGLVRRELGVLENNAACSVASSAAYMTGGGNLAALPAILMLTGARMPPVEMALWFALIAALGVLAAIPLKRRFINVEALPFSDGNSHGPDHPRAARRRRRRLSPGAPARRRIAAGRRDHVPPRQPRALAAGPPAGDHRPAPHARRPPGRALHTGRRPEPAARRCRGADERAHRVVAAAGRAAPVRRDRPGAGIAGRDRDGRLPRAGVVVGVAGRRHPGVGGAHVAGAGLAGAGALASHLAPGPRRRGSARPCRVSALVGARRLRPAGPAGGIPDGAALRAALVERPGGAAAVAGDGGGGGASHRRDRRDADAGAGPGDPARLRRAGAECRGGPGSPAPTSPPASGCTRPTCSPI